MLADRSEGAQNSVLALGRLISFGFRKKRRQAGSRDAPLTSNFHNHNQRDRRPRFSLAVTRRHSPSLDRRSAFAVYAPSFRKLESWNMPDQTSEQQIPRKFVAADIPNLWCGASATLRPFDRGRRAGAAAAVPDLRWLDAGSDKQDQMIPLVRRRGYTILAPA